MFDVGFTEILMIGVVALVVIGPERLPAVAKTAGQWIGKLQRFVRGVKTDLASELQSGDLKKLIGDQREQINELRNMVSSAKKDFESNTRDVVQGAKKSLGEIESSVKELDEAASPGLEKTSAVSVKSVPAEPDSGSRNSTAAMGINTIDSPAETGKDEDSPVMVDSEAGASSAPSPDSVNTLPPGADGDHDTSTMRTDSSGSLDDSVDRSRTGTESGK